MASPSIFKSLCKELLQSFCSLLYPPLCLHCSEGLSNCDDLFCRMCNDLLVLIEPLERCNFCFRLQEQQACAQICSECRSKKNVVNGLASAFEYMGPARSLTAKMKYGNLPYLAEGCGAFMGAQLLHLKWPLPDIIVPVPISRMHLLERGYNQSLLLANSVGTIFSRPVVEALYRSSGDYSQAGMAKEQRTQLKADSIKLRKNAGIEEKTILLIDDVITTGSTIRCCAEALLGGFPDKIFALSLCKAA